MAVPETMRTNEDRMVGSISCQRIHAGSGEVVSSQVFLQERTEDMPGNSSGDNLTGIFTLLVAIPR